MSFVIDNGSGLYKAGFSSDVKPSVLCEPLVHRSREKASGQYGSFIGLHGPRSKTPFDEGVLIHSELMEVLLDYTFIKGNPTNKDIQSILVTEPLCNPSFSRNALLELLFEAYTIPQVSLAIDSLLSFKRNKNESSGLVVSISHSQAHIIPILEGIANFKQAKRLSVGTGKLIKHMRHIIQLKYSDFPHILGSRDYENYVTQYCYVAQHYNKELYKLLNSHDDDIIQYSVTQLINQPVIEKVALTPEEQHRLKTDRSGWIADLMQEKKKLESKVNRSMKFTSSRNKSETQSRMRVMASLLEEDEEEQNGPNSKGMRRKRRRQDERFGDDMADWQMYSSLSKDGVEGDDEEDQMNLLRIDRLLAEYDPHRQERSRQKSTMLHRLAYGTINPSQLTFEEQLIREHQICLNLERIRVPEVLFQPTLIGIDECGISEAIMQVLHQHSKSEQKSLVNQILCTGGGSKFTGLQQRLLYDLRKEIPDEMNLNVNLAEDPVLDAWYAACQASLPSILRKDYLEEGTYRFQHHEMSNPI